MTCICIGVHAISKRCSCHGIDNNVNKKYNI